MKISGEFRDQQGDHIALTDAARHKAVGQTPDPLHRVGVGDKALPCRRPLVDGAFAAIRTKLL